MTTKESQILELQMIQSFCMATTTANPQDFGDYIPVADAGKAHSHWLKQRYGTIDPDTHDVVGVSFGINKLQDLLKTPGCAGLRFYFVKSINDVGGLRREHDDLVIVPYDQYGDDMLPVDKTMRKNRTDASSPLDHTVGPISVPRAGDSVMNTSRPCPNYCSQ